MKKPKVGQNGKGDKPRPLLVPRKKFDENFDQVFKRKKDENKKRVRK